MARTATATMRAVAVTPMRAGSARQVELPVPTATRDMALMRVLEVGIDGTDTEINSGLYGEAPPGSDFLVIGHEALSVVEAVGEGVSGFSRGDLVVSTVRRPDDCPNCRAGESDMCLFGRYTERGIKGAHGYMGEYYAETPAFMIKIPPVLRPFAVLLEPLRIVEKATAQAWKIGPLSSARDRSASSVRSCCAYAASMCTSMPSRHPTRCRATSLPASAPATKPSRITP
ncbi:MAG: hypothetical protein E6I10_00905 [Chloroflexi bacterium]|nr:MAG: hypothetical protein E6I10_00905 [Chloroflexota bacterium]